MMQGKIQTLNLWKGSTKGFFMRVNGKEYTAFGEPKVQVGDEIEFEDSGADKYKPDLHLAKNIRKAEQSYFDPSKIAEMAKVVMQSKSFEMPKGEDDNNKRIERLALMKMATRIVCAQIKNGIGADGNPNNIAERIRKQANELKAIL